MRRIVLTGFCREEFLRLKDKEEGVTRCYLCKRRHGKKGIFLEMGEEGPKSAHSSKMNFQLISMIEEHNNEPVKFCFYLCTECRMLFEAMGEKLNRGESVFAKETKGEAGGI